MSQQLTILSNPNYHYLASLEHLSNISFQAVFPRSCSPKHAPSALSGAINPTAPAAGRGVVEVQRWTHPWAELKKRRKMSTFLVVAVKIVMKSWARGALMQADSTTAAATTCYFWFNCFLPTPPPPPPPSSTPLQVGRGI